MERTIEVVYEAGVLRPLEPLPFKEHQRLIATVSEKQQDDKPPQPDPYRYKEMAWLAQHRKEYEGEYVALDGDRLVAHSKDGKEVRRLAREAGAERPLISYIHPPDDPPTFGFVMCPTP